MTINYDTINQTLSFDSVAGEKFYNLKLVALLDAATVAALGQDPAARHKQYLPYMAEPLPALYTDYLYGKFVNADGASSYYGIPWIKDSSIVVNNTVVYLITVKNASPSSIDSIKQMMTKSGITDFSVNIQ